MNFTTPSPNKRGCFVNNTEFHFIMNTQISFLGIKGLLLLLVITLSIVACKKTIQTPEIPILTTKTPASITESTAVVGGFVSSDGGTVVTERGVCYSLTSNPTISDLAVNLGSGVGTFQGVLTGLSPNTNYYMRAYALNSAGIGYGNQLTFTTLGSIGAPTVTTSPVTNITTASAICGGTVVSSGTATVTIMGVCWSTSQLPTISDNHTVDSSGTGSYSSSITGLTQNTVYYVRAYAENSIGIAYGNQVTFTTLGSAGILPVVTTGELMNITSTTAISGGNVSSQGSSPVTERGVCWSISPNPTSLDDHTTNGSGLGIFSSNVTGLSPLTTYYLRAYAVNSAGIAYGDTINFTTLDPGPCPPVTYEGKTYQTVIINSQCWLKENLNVGTLIEGSQAQDPGNELVEKYCYDNLESNCEIYGGLYQWDEMMQGSITPGEQGICPPDWRIPTDEEYTALIDSLGGDSIAGGKLKKAGIAQWQTPNNGATNESGFTAIPGGYRDFSGNFGSIKTTAIIWSSTQNDATVAWYRSLYFSSVSVGQYSGLKTAGSSVRCVKN